MSTSKKQISISTNLSNNNEFIDLYNNYKQSIICRYTSSNNDTLINPVFTTFVDDIINNNNYTDNLSIINNYYSRSSFNLIYNINKNLKRFDDLIFNNCPTLYAVVNIPESFKVIGKYAFNGCNSLKYVNIGKSINEIKEFAFNGANHLTDLDVSNVYKLHNYSFAGCGIKSIELNKKVTNLYHYLFKDCKNLQSFVNNNIANVGEGVFCGCTSLEYVELSNYKGIYDSENEYIESIEDISKNKYAGEIGIEYDVEFLDKTNGEILGFGKILTIENISDDEELWLLVRFVITESYDEDMIGKTFYVGSDCLEDTSSEGHYHYYDEEGEEVDSSDIRLFIDPYIEPEPVDIEPYRWRLYDNNDNMIGRITEEFANFLKTYNSAHGGNFITTLDTHNGTELIYINQDITYIEYYIDGITPTGNVYNSPTQFQSYDNDQFIRKYKYYSKVDNSDIITLTDDINVNLVFNSDFTECHIKLNGYPVYEASERYVAYYMYEPFLSIRKEYDDKLVIKSGSNNNAYVDNGFVIKYTGNIAKYPVYNKNFCYLGRLNNGEWLEYTNQTELDTFASRLESHIIYDSSDVATEFVFFMMPISNNYADEDLVEDRIDEVIAAIREIIDEIIAFKTGSNPEEEEESLTQFDHFNLKDLGYYGTKYDLPNMLFASCIKLNNDNIVKTGNYNPNLSHVNIKFTNQLSSKNIYIGEWQDVIGFRYYNPFNAAYNYTFKWRYLTYADKDYISISINGKTYFIDESFDEINGIYSRKLVDNIYDTPNIVEDFICNSLTTLESIFNIDIFNKVYLMHFPIIQQSIYDKYYLLDTIENVGNNAFMNCLSITEINNHFTSIGDYAFKDCINLKHIALNRTKNIGKYAFQNCDSLTEVFLNYLISTDKNEGVFYNCKNLTTVNNLSLSEIPNKFFKNCYSLKNIQMNEIEKINNESFANCKSLVINNINSLRNITYFGDYSLMGCTNLQSISFNENIEYIGKGVFKNCINLTTVELPISINNLTEELFYGCKNLKSVVFNVPVNDVFELSGIDACNNIESISIPNGGRYVTPNNQFIFDTETNTIIYVCKQVSVINIQNNYDNVSIGNTINISNTAFNNCKVSIINIDQNISTPDVNSYTFDGIKNETYHILINKEDPKYDKYYELVGKNHIYYI